MEATPASAPRGSQYRWLRARGRITGGLWLLHPHRKHRFLDRYENCQRGWNNLRPDRRDLIRLRRTILDDLRENRWLSVPMRAVARVPGRVRRSLPSSEGMPRLRL